VAAIFTSRLANDRAPLVFEDGKQSRDFVHVRDIARANVAALTSSGGDGQPLNVGTGRATTIEEIARLLAARMGKAIAPEINGKYRPGDIRHCIADPSRLEKAYGFRPSITLEQGIDELIEWSRSEDPTDRVDVAMKELQRRKLVR
jgi:dTDP-L-rhamnose 4-epimerase